MARITPFRGGLPYGPDLRRLHETFPANELAEGRVIQHELLEGVLDCKRGTQRYYAVCNSWITQVRNSAGIFMVWEPTVGLKVLDPPEILYYAEKRTRQKLRQTGKAIRTFGWVNRNRLDEVGQRRLDHQMRVAAAVSDALEGAKKQLAVDLLPIRSLPKRLA